MKGQLRAPAIVPSSTGSQHQKHRGPTRTQNPSANSAILRASANVTGNNSVYMENKAVELTTNIFC